MAKKGIISTLVAIAVWLTGVLVSLAVGFGMIGGKLTLPSWLGGAALAMIAGWVVVILTFVGIILALFNK